MRKKHRSIIKVEKYRGEKVFVHGKLRFDRIPPQLALDLVGKKKISFMRDDEKRETAVLVEIGTHGARPVFHGFMGIIDNVFTELNPGMFLTGDTIVMPCSASAFRASVLVWWRAKRYRRRFRPGSERLVMSSNNDIEAAHHRFMSKVRSEPLPSVLRIQE